MPTPLAPTVPQPSDCDDWRKLFVESLWPSRGKWKGVEASEATGFRASAGAELELRFSWSRTKGSRQLEPSLSLRFSWS